MKRCADCKRTLPEDAFYRQSSGKPRSYCKECFKARVRRQSIQVPTKRVAEKYCPRCQQMLPADQFYRNQRRTTGMSDYCKACTGQFTAAWERTHVEQRRSYNRRSWARHGDRRRAEQRDRYRRRVGQP
jgi:recombinational DNA repair protein (RecF pathway)